MADVPAITSLDELLAWLQAALDPTRTQVATRVLTEFFKNEACLPALAEVLACAPSEYDRQAAALYISRAMRHWGSLSVGAQIEIRNALLGAALTDSNKLVRQSGSHAVTVVARRMLITNGWDELLPTLHAAATSSDENARTSAFAMFKLLVPFFGENNAGFFLELAPLCASGLTDPQPFVRLHCMGALVGMAMFASEESQYAQFRALFPAFFETIAVLLQHDEVTRAVAALSLFEEMIEIVPDLMNKMWTSVVSFAVQLANEPDVSQLAMRVRGVSFLLRLVEIKPAAISKHKLAEPILNVVFVNITMEGELEAKLTLPRIAAQLLDRICMCLPPSITYEPCMEAVQTMLAPDASPAYRRGGMLTLSMMAEGCQETMRPLTATLAPMAIAALEDPDEGVRDAAASALGQFCEWMRPQIYEFHAQIIQGACMLLQHDEHIPTRLSALATIDYLIEYLDESQFMPYLSDLLSTLLGVVQASERECAAIAVTAIGVVATSSRRLFQPYFADTMQVLLPLIQRTEDEALTLRARAIDAIGQVGCAVGKDMFAPLLADCMQNALEGLDLGYFELNEFTFAFFGRIATMLGPDVAPYADTVIALACKVVTSDDLALFTGEDGDGDDGGGGGGGGGGDDDDDSELDGREYTVPPGVQDEKGSAACCIGAFASALGAAFEPYVDQAVDALTELVDYDNYEVRATTLAALNDVVQCVYYASQPAPWQAGLPVAVPVHASVRQALEMFVPLLLKRIHAEESPDVVSRALGIMQALLRQIGPVVLETPENSDLFTACCVLILTRESICQHALTDSDGAGPDMNIESPIDLAILETDNVAEAIEAALLALGPSAVPMADKLIEPLLAYCLPNKPVYERCSGIGVISAFFDALGTAAEPLVEGLLPVYLDCLADGEEEVRRNAAFGLGLMAVAAPGRLVGQAQACLVGLFYAASQPYEDGAVMDNIVAAMCRFIMAIPAAVPVAELVPLLVSQLPLKADLSENKTVYTCLLSLFAASDEHVFGQLPLLLPVFAHDLAEAGRLDDAMRAELCALLAALASHEQVAAHFHGMLERLDPAASQVIREVLK